MYYFFFNAPPTTEIYTLSLHDALPIFEQALPDQLFKCSYRKLETLLNERRVLVHSNESAAIESHRQIHFYAVGALLRSEEHTSELQSRRDLVCRLLLEKKKKTRKLKST